ncbi:hypothetical protein A3K79_06605 [Candidatus Bathyarchaeota archaeon RBG_13_46_16b]|nr:MAG: hypothetical protein A3K79_06605 [Candidatus Bathyarchaeota archaeon RBG_13_46_16b]
MLKNKKTGSSGRVGESEKHKLRMFRSAQAFQVSLVSVERIGQENVREDFREDIRAVILEAECKKAKAMMALQNYRRFY